MPRQPRIRRQQQGERIRALSSAFAGICCALTQRRAALVPPHAAARCHWLEAAIATNLCRY